MYMYNSGVLGIGGIGAMVLLSTEEFYPGRSILYAMIFFY